VPASREARAIAERFHAALEAQGWRTASLVVRRFDAAAAAADSELVDQLRAFVRDAAEIIEIGQSSTVALADAYVSGSARAELGERVALKPDPEAIGSTWDGRALESGLGASIAKVWHARALGRPLEKALAFGRFSAERFAFTETLDAGRQELTTKIRELPEIEGWRWRSRGTCSACMSADDGRIRGEGFIRPHPYCRCVPEPVFRGRRQIGRPTGPQRFERLSPAEQNEAVGEEVAQLLRENRVDWGDVVKVVDPEDWRPMITRRPVEELRKLAGAAAAEEG
jgi:hypothetical protein